MDTQPAPTLARQTPGDLAAPALPALAPADAALIAALHAEGRAHAAYLHEDADRPGLHFAFQRYQAARTLTHDALIAARDAALRAAKEAPPC